MAKLTMTEQGEVGGQTSKSDLSDGVSGLDDTNGSDLGGTVEALDRNLLADPGGTGG
jgi:hypothetical protein